MENKKEHTSEVRVDELLRASGKNWAFIKLDELMSDFEWNEPGHCLAIIICNLQQNDVNSWEQTLSAAEVLWGSYYHKHLGKTDFYFKKEKNCKVK